MIQRCIQDPAFFAERMVGKTPYWYNAEFLRTLARLIIYRGGRQSGKTTSIALFILYCVIFAKWRVPLPVGETEGVVTISAGREYQADIILRRIKAFCRHSQFCKQFVKDIKVDRIILQPLGTNQEWIIMTRALGDDGESGRGESTSIIVIDEVQGVSKDKIDAVLPSGMTRKPIILIAGTPNGAQGDFYAWCKSARLGFRSVDDVYSKDPKADWVQFCSMSKWSPDADPKFLEAERKRMSPEMYQQEYEAQFIGVGNAMFPRAEIVECLNRTPLPNMLYYDIGIDVSGAGRDQTVYSIYHTDGLKANLVELYAEGISQIPYMVDKLEAYCKQYEVRNIFVEDNGIGKGVYDVGRSIGLPMRAVTVTRNNKADNHVHLLHMMESGLVSFRDCKIDGRPLSIHDEAILQMVEVERDVQGDTMFIPQTDKPNDFPDSMVLGVKGCRLGSGIGVIQYNKDTAQVVHEAFSGHTKQKTPFGGI